MNFHDGNRRVSGHVANRFGWHFTFRCVAREVGMVSNVAQQLRMGWYETIRSGISIHGVHQFRVLRMRLDVAQTERVAWNVTKRLRLWFG